MAVKYYKVKRIPGGRRGRWERGDLIGVSLEGKVLAAYTLNSDRADTLGLRDNRLIVESVVLSVFTGQIWFLDFKSCDDARHGRANCFTFETDAPLSMHADSARWSFWDSWFSSVRFCVLSKVKDINKYWQGCPAVELRDNDFLSMAKELSGIRGSEESRRKCFDKDCQVYGLMADLLTDIGEDVHARALRLASEATIPEVATIVWT